MFCIKMVQIQWVHVKCALWCVLNFGRLAGFCMQARMNRSISTVLCDVMGVVTLFSLSTSGGGQASVCRPG